MTSAYDIIAALVENIEEDIPQENMSKHLHQALYDAISYLVSINKGDKNND